MDVSHTVFLMLLMNIYCEGVSAFHQAGLKIKELEESRNEGINQ